MDATDPLGVRITTQAGLATLEMSADMFVVSLAANSDVTYTCGSVTAKVTAGATTIGIGPGGSVTFPSGGEVTVDGLASGNYVVVNKGTTTVTVTRGGVTATLAAGATTASSPQSKGDCKKDGWAAYGVFKNQGTACPPSLRAAERIGTTGVTTGRSEPRRLAAPWWATETTYGHVTASLQHKLGLP